MKEENQASWHDEIKHLIARGCSEYGFQVAEEYRGTDWRADVFATDGGVKFAFEIQITRQSLNRTLERQSKYLRDGILGCWLFENEPPGSAEERVDLPLFKLEREGDEVVVSLKARKKLPIRTFVADFLGEKIQFRESVVTSSRQLVEVSFIRMDCWKCKALNHIYFVNNGYNSSCNTRLSADEMMWDSNLKEYRPEIVESVRKYILENPDKGLVLGPIAERHSYTVGHSYMSFGCASCNAIFGDWFVYEERIESLYGDGVVDAMKLELDMDVGLRIDLPHWCHPGDGPFCE